MLRKADNNYVQQWKVPREEMDELRGPFDAAVQAMQVWGTRVGVFCTLYALPDTGCAAGRVTRLHDVSWFTLL